MHPTPPESLPPTSRWRWSALRRPDLGCHWPSQGSSFWVDWKVSHPQNDSPLLQSSVSRKDFCLCGCQCLDSTHSLMSPSWRTRHRPCGALCWAGALRCPGPLRTSPAPRPLQAAGSTGGRWRAVAVSRALPRHVVLSPEQIAQGLKSRLLPSTDGLIIHIDVLTGKVGELPVRRRWGGGNGCWSVKVGRTAPSPFHAPPNPRSHCHLFSRRLGRGKNHKQRAVLRKTVADCL